MSKELSSRTEDYIEVIHTVIQSKGYAKVKDISKVLGVGPSSVTEMLQKLGKDGYVNYEKYGAVTLTPKGEKIAKSLDMKHKTLREFLVMLGVDEKVANEDACKIEHIVSGETVDRLNKFLEFVAKGESTPRWLDHFEYYYETGEYITCNAETRKDCPVHANKK